MCHLEWGPAKDKLIIITLATRHADESWILKGQEIGKFCWADEIKAHKIHGCGCWRSLQGAGGILRVSIVGDGTVPRERKRREHKKELYDFITVGFSIVS